MPLTSSVPDHGRKVYGNSTNLKLIYYVHKLVLFSSLLFISLQLILVPGSRLGSIIGCSLAESRITRRVSWAAPFTYLDLDFPKMYLFACLSWQLGGSTLSLYDSKLARGLSKRPKAEGRFAFTASHTAGVQSPTCGQTTLFLRSPRLFLQDWF
jgi:hypothetical protein